MKDSRWKSVGIYSLSVIGLGSALAQAAPGVLSDKPLFLGSSVQPNILWLVDDSGSMDYEVLKTEGGRAVYGFSESGALDITPSRNDRDEIIESCVGYNAMYYDPLKTYTPWVGLDSTGAAYADQSITAAMSDPYYPNGTKVNLTAPDGAGDRPGYMVWTDLDNDEYFDQGECPDPYDSDYDYESSFTETTEMSAEEQTNFANWYSYYRKREYVAKRALSEIIDSSQARMGLATLHNNNSVGTLIEDVDNITTPVDATAATNKQTLLNNLFRINSSGGTPLRTTLKKAGQYFQEGTSSTVFGSSTSSSPLLSASDGGACQQNFSILMSDGTWNGSSPSVGNTDGDDDTAFDGGSHGDSVWNTLADVAMKYYEIDLSPTLDNEVPTVTWIDDDGSTQSDENTAQHMVTYTVAFGVNGNLTANPPDRTTPFAWPTPTANNVKTIDDMRHAAWNGRGKFLSAGNPGDLIDSLQNAINDISDRESSASSVAFNSTSINTDTLVFQALFNPASWSGTLAAYEFDEDGVGDLSWSAGDILDSRDLTTDPREIITFNGTQGVPFRFPSDYTALDTDTLSANQINDLLTAGPHSSTTADTTEIASNQSYGAALVDYLRGDHSNEEGKGGSFSFRNRNDHRLGDIVYSSPAYVGAPSLAYPNYIEGSANPYSDFIAAKASRTPMVYVGSNDGMLHGFKAENGEEVIAYIPSFLFDDTVDRGLHYLADKTYSHIPYVDGSPLSADVFIGSSWRTYLVGGVRAGGKGIYVLDVTNPQYFEESYADSMVKQEFTHNDLGYTFSRPTIGKMNNGRWAAIFGNGYNSDPNGDGKAKLFILYLDATGGYELIDTGVGSMVNADCSDADSDCNGLSSTTALDLNGDGTVDRVYGGDIHGNVWAFDISDTSSSNWEIAHEDSGSTNPVPLFSACNTSPCTSADRQPITTLTVAADHPYRFARATAPNLMIYVGTGQWLTESDNFSTDRQSVYGVWDAGIGELDRSNLQVQTITNQVTVDPDDSDEIYVTREISDNSVSYMTSDEFGWYVDLPDYGERMVTEASIVGDIIFFSTTVPEATQCSSGGYGYLMFADRMTGGEPDFTVLDLNNDGVYDDAIVSGLKIDDIPGGSRLIDDKLVVSDSGGSIRDYGVQTSPTRASSRSSWSILK